MFRAAYAHRIIDNDKLQLELEAINTEVEEILHEVQVFGMSGNKLKKLIIECKDMTGIFAMKFIITKCLCLNQCHPVDLFSVYHQIKLKEAFPEFASFVYTNNSKFS